MTRKTNFGAGPATLPAEVLQQLSAAMLSYGHTGLPLPELEHRGAPFAAILEECNALLRELCDIDNDYEVLWLHGGGRQQFCMVPQNFLTPHTTAAYIDSGYWAREAMQYAAYYGQSVTVASSADTAYDRLPEWPATLPLNTAYLHLTTNNTIYGTQWHTLPAATAPLVADMSSDILSRHHNYRQYALFYAAAQKNLGLPGVAVAVIHCDMLARANRNVPPLLSYAAQAREKSVVNTANVMGVYASLLMLRWTKERGIDAIEAENAQKAELLYNHLASSKLFQTRVAVAAHRSLMNVCFSATDTRHEKALLQLCEEHNMTGIKGHRSTGGFRVSLYNAVRLPDVQRLVTLMQQYEDSVQE